MMLRLSIPLFLGNAMQSCVGDGNAEVHAIWAQQLDARVARAKDEPYTALRAGLVASEAACDMAGERGASSASAMKLATRCEVALPILRTALVRTDEWAQAAGSAKSTLEEATRPTKPGPDPLGIVMKPPHRLTIARECLIARRTATLSEHSRALAALCDENDTLPAGLGM